RLEMPGETEVLEAARLGGDHAVGAGGAVFVEHQVDAVAVGAAERQGVVVVLALEKNLLLALGEKREVEAERILGGERVSGNLRQRAILADEGSRAGREVEIARAEAGGGLEQLAESGGETGVVERADGFERK